MKQDLKAPRVVRDEQRCVHRFPRVKWERSQQARCVRRGMPVVRVWWMDVEYVSHCGHGCWWSVTCQTFVGMARISAVLAEALVLVGRFGK